MVYYDFSTPVSLSLQKSELTLKDRHFADKVQKVLMGISCSDLRKFIRATGMKLNGIKKMAKSDLVESLMYRLKTKEVEQWLYTKLKDSVEFAEAESIQIPNGTAWHEQIPKHEQIVYRLYRRYDALKSIHEKKYEKLAPVCKKHKQVKPIFGSGVDSDCPRGHIMLDETGCCVNMDMVLKGHVWSADVVKEGLERAKHLAGSQAAFVKDYFENAKKSLESLDLAKYRSEADMKASMNFLALMQQKVAKDMAENFDYFLQYANTDEVCDLEGEELTSGIAKYWNKFKTLVSPSTYFSAETLQIAETAKRIVGTILYMLWKLIYLNFKILHMAVFDFLIPGVTFVVRTAWGGAKTLVTIGQKFAHLIVTDPGKARIILAVANKVKKGLCKYIGEKIANSPLMQYIEGKLSNKTMDEETTEEDKTKELNTQLNNVDMVKDKLQAAATRGLSLAQMYIQLNIGLVTIITDYFDIKSFKAWICEFNAHVEKATVNFGERVDSLDKRQREKKKKEKSDAKIAEEYAKWAKENPVQAGFARMAENTKNVVSAGASAGASALQFASDSGMPGKITSDMLKNKSVMAGAEAGVATMVSKAMDLASVFVGMAPGLGTAAAGGIQAAKMLLVDPLAASLTARAKEVAEMYIYASHMLESFKMLLDFLDIEACLVEMVAIRERCPYIYMNLIFAREVAWGYAKMKLNQTIGLDDIVSDMKARIAEGVTDGLAAAGVNMDLGLTAEDGQKMDGPKLDKSELDTSKQTDAFIPYKTRGPTPNGTRVTDGFRMAPNIAPNATHVADGLAEDNPKKPSPVKVETNVPTQDNPKKPTPLIAKNSRRPFDLERIVKVPTQDNPKKPTPLIANNSRR